MLCTEIVFDRLCHGVGHCSVVFPDQYPHRHEQLVQLLFGLFLGVGIFTLAGWRKRRAGLGHQGVDRHLPFLRRGDALKPFQRLDRHPRGRIVVHLWHRHEKPREPHRLVEALHVGVDLAVQLFEQRLVQPRPMRVFEQRVEAKPQRLLVVVRRLQRQHWRLQVRVVALAELVPGVEHKRVLAPALDALERPQLLRGRAAADRVRVGQRRHQRAVEGVAIHLRVAVRLALALGGRHRGR